jgi:hypothetical protein
MTVNTAAALLGFVGLVLCVIPFAWAVWEVGRVRPDVREARRVGRTMIAISAAAFPVVSVLVTDGFAAPMFAPGVPVLGVPAAFLFQVVAVAAYVVGLVWMIRIYRTSHLEPNGSSWRYRG